MSRHEVLGLEPRVRLPSAGRADGLDAFVGRLAHQLGAGLALVHGYLELIDGDPAGAEREPALRSGLDRLQLINDDLLELAGSRRRPLELAPTSLAVAVSRAWSVVERRLPNAGPRLELGRLPAVIADPAALRRAFVHLLRGAVTVTDGLDTPVHVSGEAADGLARCRISHRGAAVATELGDIASRLCPEWSGRGPLVGAGVSLVIATQLVERMEGSVGGWPDPRGGRCIVVTLPAAPS